MNPLILDNQKKALINLKRDAQTLNEDQIVFISKYHVKTGLKTQLVSLLITIRRTLSAKLDSDLLTKFKTLKQDYGQYLQERIDSLSEHAEDTARAEIGDILFASAEVSKLGLKIWSQQEAVEIGRFQATSLSTIIDTLGKNEQREEIVIGFNELQEAMKNSQFDEAQRLVENIQTLIK